MATVIPPFLDRASIEPQELFDFAVRALHAMPHRAADPKTGMCRYRLDDPSCPACIAGQMLTDDEVKISSEMRARNFAQLDAEGDDYFPLEGVETLDRLDDPGFNNLVTLDLVPARLRPHQQLIVELQQIHDANENWMEGRERMASQLRGLAVKYGRSHVVVDELWPVA